MFALAFYRTSTRELVLARDPIGIKPLYWLTDRQGLVFASQYDQIVRHPWCNTERIQPEVLGLYLRLGYLPSPWGLIDNTHQLPQGHFLRASPGRPPTIHRYCELADHTKANDPPHTEEALATALLSATERQMMSDVPIGAFLSGGVDSPLVTAIMAAQSGRLPAFTIGTDDPGPTSLRTQPAMQRRSVANITPGSSLQPMHSGSSTTWWTRSASPSPTTRHSPRCWCRSSPESV